MGDVKAIPGASAVMRIQVRKYDGSLAVLDGGSIATIIHCFGVDDEPAAQVVEADAQTRLVVISGAQTSARAGKRVRVRAFITPADSYEVVGSEAFINVGV